jgi:hypothetical protein
MCLLYLIIKSVILISKPTDFVDIDLDTQLSISMFMKYLLFCLEMVDCFSIDLFGIFLWSFIFIPSLINFGR